ncbi:WYL domain-containing protein [Cytobacillus oceanisediminis]|uniref:WYL domain-containing protein n=1 Tax=Cytobacillus oceanisediminis TaxID=665099 RepID=UPI001CCE7375|nr:WYL domain-containing protein [Cytobacillus oceanisediminis]
MMIKQLERAFVEGKPIEIIYIKKDNSVSQRSILINRVTETYIKAYCLAKKQPRIFKVDSILAASFKKEQEELLHA